ncbi:MAG: NADPH-dependent glutamate synthase, partial [Alistipes sp.]|nr:NADPH-dependent glutamate synthase [Alistipes sp.]
IISRDSLLPSICGRVCPQETQCEGSCILGIKSEPVAIGKLERYVGDWKIAQTQTQIDIPQWNGRKVAVVGSGPSGLACAGDLAAMGYKVKVFEALHKLGGVLVYGIPEFRLPKHKIVEREIDSLRRLGVEFETDVIIGRTLTIDELLDNEGYDAVFVGSGAGLPRFMGIEGENLNGVFSANEFLTRVNLMGAYDPSTSDTPVYVGRKVVVVGGGNVAMDAVRTAKRLGAEAVIVYRRSEAELPARVEEVHHAREEGIEFRMLTNPTRILADDNGWVKGISCVQMTLGEPDQSGRRSPVVVEGSDFEIDCDVVIMALGTSPNPLIASTTEGLAVNRRGCIEADDNGATSCKGVFAGGDTVTGAATVILAMGAGRRSAKAIDEYIKGK